LASISSNLQAGCDVIVKQSATLHVDRQHYMTLVKAEASLSFSILSSRYLLGWLL